MSRSLRGHDPPQGEATQRGNPCLSHDGKAVEDVRPEFPPHVLLAQSTLSQPFGELAPKPIMDCRPIKRNRQISLSFSLSLSLVALGSQGSNHDEWDTIRAR